MSDKWLVLKFGGTSVAGRKQWAGIESLARHRLDQNYRVVLVCSAVAGITNSLQSLAEPSEAPPEKEINSVLERHRKLAAELQVEAEDILLEARKHIISELEQIHGAATSQGRYGGIANLLPIGEWMSSRIGARFLAQRLTLEWVDACEALHALEEENPSSRRAWLSARCNSAADPELQKSWATKTPLLITQGFVATGQQGGRVLLGRGGSDTSAVLLASRLQAHHVEIWTDVAGLFSADPRDIPTAQLLRTLDYDEALEMAASGAKVVHSRCIRVAADAKIPVLIKDLNNPQSSGTTITHNDGSQAQTEEGIRAVCRQSHIAVLLLQNLDTREHVGFLAWVFAQISHAGVSIDLVATSETTTTIAINMVNNHLNDDALSEIAESLRQRCAVTVFPKCCAINLVGRGARVALAALDPGSAFFSRHPLLMLSQSANDLSISLIVHTADADELLLSLHATLIAKTPAHEGH